MRRFFYQEKLQNKVNFWTFRRLRKIKACKDFQLVGFQQLLLCLQGLYRIQNLAIETLDLESRAFQIHWSKTQERSRLLSFTVSKYIIKDEN